MSLSIVALPALERGLGSDGRWSGAASAMSGGGPTPEARGRETYPRRQMPGSRQPMSSGGPTPEARGRETTLEAEEQRRPCRRVGVGPHAKLDDEGALSGLTTAEQGPAEWHT